MFSKHCFELRELFTQTAALPRSDNEFVDFPSRAVSRDVGTVGFAKFVMRNNSLQFVVVVVVRHQRQL